MITQEHADFDRDVVLLARKHGMNHLDMTFNAASCNNFLKDRGGKAWDNVKMAWSESRHGGTGKISLTCEEHTVIEERVAP